MQHLEVSKDNQDLIKLFEESKKKNKNTVFQSEKKAQDLFNENKELKQVCV